MTKSALSSFESLQPLRALTALVCVYLEHSPVAQVRIQMLCIFDFYCGFLQDQQGSLMEPVVRITERDH